MNSSYQHSATMAFLTQQPWQVLFSYIKKDSVSQFQALLSQMIIDLDDAITKQLSAVIQNPHFKQLESIWLGIDSLASLPVSKRRVKIKFLDWDWDDLSKDLNRSVMIEHSIIYKKIYSDEFDTAGGMPFGMLFVDHKIKSDPSDDSDFDDLYTLQLLSELGEISLCPIALGVDYFFLGDDPPRLFHDGLRAERILSSKGFSSWALLRQKQSSRFLHLVFPEYLLRTAYQQCPAGFMFNESQAPEYSLWGNSGFLLVANVIREFDRISWFGYLKAYDLSAKFGAIIQSAAPLFSRVDLYSEDDAFWADQGFIPLCSLYLTEQKGFFSNQSVWIPPNDTFRQVASLQSNLMGCRFAHYIKIQIRDKLGLFDGEKDCKKSLESWLQKYTSNSNYSDVRVLGSHPLKKFRVEIEKVPEDITRYRCEIMLTLQYQCDALDVSVFLNTSVAYQDARKVL